MKHFLTLFFLAFSIQSFSQNLKKILTKAELDSVQKNYTIIKSIDKTNAKHFDGLEGKIGVKKLDNKIIYFFIGRSQQFGPNGEVLVTMDSDSLGFLQRYYEVNLKDEMIFDCVYEYQKVNGKLYRIEHQKLYYGPNRLKEEGKRYLQIADVGIGNQYISSNKGLGKWIYYTIDGEIEKIEDFGEIK